MPRVLVLFAHPALQKSRVHARLVAAARGVAGVTVHDLYEVAPDFDLDVPAEQARLLDADIIGTQHPFYWYSIPPLLKQWIDLTLEHGWAYGSTGTALRGKRAASAVSAGGGDAAYGPTGRNRYTLDEFLRPVEATWRLCGVEWLPPFLVTGTHALQADGIAAAASRYADWLRTLVGEG